VRVEDTPSTYEQYWLDRLLIDELQRQDEHWEDLIGWIPFFNTTLQLYDLHVERHGEPLNTVGRSDCTHFIYSPFMFLPLWLDMTKAFETFLPRNRRNYIRSFVRSTYQSRYVLKTPSSDAIYLVVNGTKRHVQNMEVFQSLGLQLSDVVYVTDEFIDFIPTGAVLITGS